jgi:hypothetical protein
MSSGDGDSFDYDIFNYMFAATEVHFDGRRIYHGAQSIPDLEVIVNNKKDSRRGQITEVLDMQSGRQLKFTTKAGAFVINRARN